jgi:hypothetical protein
MAVPLTGTNPVGGQVGPEKWLPELAGSFGALGVTQPPLLSVSETVAATSVVMPIFICIRN